jgi:hypothetical protein
LVARDAYPHGMGPLANRACYSEGITSLITSISCSK